MKPYGLSRRELSKAVQLAALYDTARISEWAVRCLTYFSTEQARQQLAVNTLRRYVDEWELAILSEEDRRKFARLLWIDGTGTFMLDHVIKVIEKQSRDSITHD